MTSDTAKPETKPQAKPETFRSHLPAIVAATTGTVLAAILGSLIGTAGTIVGMVIGSLASGTFSWWAERGIRRSTALATAQAEALRARGHHAHVGENADATQTAPTRSAVQHHGRARPRRRWTVPAMFVAIAFAGCALVITLVEGAAGKPLSAVVQGKPGYGTTLGGGSVGKTAPASPSPKPSVSVTGGTTAPAASTPSAGTSSSPPASVSPSATAPATSPPATSPPATSPPATSPPAATPTPTGTATAG